MNQQKIGWRCISTVPHKVSIEKGEDGNFRYINDLTKLIDIHTGDILEPQADGSLKKVGVMPDNTPKTGNKGFHKKY